MTKNSNDIDYYEQNYPYHVEVFSKCEIKEDCLILYFDNGKNSHFSLSESGLQPNIIQARFQDLHGSVVYVYQNFEQTKDIAVELFDLTGCCSGSRKLLLG